MENLDELVLENDFKKELDEIISGSLDSKKTKKDILRIKKLLNSLVENCKEEATKEELLQEFIDAYKSELKTTKNIEEAYGLILQHRAYKELLNRYRRNKGSFDKVIIEAKKREKANNKEDIPIIRNLDECMVGAVRRLLRKGNIKSEKMLVDSISILKSKIDQTVKKNLITEIQEDLAFLNEYGFLDEYINSSNEMLRELGLEKLKYLKRNPIPDEKYDSDGNLIKDDEDIGVWDSFDTEYLEKLTIEQLTRMASFYKEKYMEARIAISEAMTVVDFLDLWDDMLEERNSTIENLDEDSVKNGLKNFEALAALFKFINNTEITEGIEKQYSMFLEKNGIRQKRTIKEEFKEKKAELENIRAAATDIVFSQCLSIYQLYSKDIKVKSWGVLKQDKRTQEIDDAISIVIEDSDFRVPYIIVLPKNILFNDLGIQDESELPELKNPDRIDEQFVKTIENLYLPTNVFYKKTVGEYYTKNPYSKLIASLAGKKVKKPDNKADSSR